MIKTRLSYSKDEIYIRPETISYIIREYNQTTIGFTNGHTYSVSASIPELLEAIKNETNTTKSDC
ncbi:MAG: hypothetical protein II393_01400 [Cytophagales bacterium]|nr:hypothetical protein [Cytophagales bacterium]MBQ5918988.1 hypothetical protein [Lachnospiraceae bacterium]